MVWSFVSVLHSCQSHDSVVGVPRSVLQDVLEEQGKVSIPTSLLTVLLISNLLAAS